MLSDPTLRSLARQSLPGYLRFGGGGNDLLSYALDMGDPASAGNKCPRGPARLCMNRSQFDNLYGFAEAAGAKLVFGLAMPRSNGGGIWNSTEARALMSYAIGSCKRLFAFELGNEQCGVFTAAETASESHAMPLGLPYSKYQNKNKSRQKLWLEMHVHPSTRQAPEHIPHPPNPGIVRLTPPPSLLLRMTEFTG